ncbi:MAG: hypothetical protein QM796_20465 [Chthoniobacteraceae bacterium]
MYPLQKLLLGIFTATVIPACLHADVKLTIQAMERTQAWAGSFGGGGLSINPAAKSENLIASKIDPGSGLAQSFKGDGKKLKAVGFYFSSTAAPAPDKKYKIALLDFGTSGPVNDSDKFNGDAKLVFSEDYTWEATRSGQAYLFEFSGASNVILDSTHYYAIALDFTDASGGNNIIRSSNDPYSDGRLAVGTQSKFQLKFAGGDRDADFVVYTAEDK